MQDGRGDYNVTMKNLDIYFTENKINLLQYPKTEYDNPSIGIILVRNKNKLNVEYALRDINKPIGVSSYELSQYLPADIIKELPTEEDLNLHIDINE